MDDPQNISLREKHEKQSEFLCLLVIVIDKPHCQSFSQCDKGHSTCWQVFDELISRRCVGNKGVASGVPNHLLEIQQSALICPLSVSFD